MIEKYSQIINLVIIFRLKFFHFLKTGLRVGVNNPESVGDHMYFMALMALTSTPENLDRSRCIEIALVHDLAECIVGDITPEKFSGVSKEVKHKMEQEAMENIVKVSEISFSKYEFLQKI